MPGAAEEYYKGVPFNDAASFKKWLDAGASLVISSIAHTRARIKGPHVAELFGIGYSQLRHGL